MQEFSFIRLNELILLIYLFSIACYFYDFLKKHHRVKMIGFVSLGIVWMLQTISLSLYVNVTKQIPLGNIFDVFFAVEWLIISIFIVFNVIKQINLSIFLFNMIYFYDFLKKHHRVKMIGFVSLGIVWMLQTISLSLYVNVTKQIPLGNIFDVFFAVAWLIISISIVINVIKQINLSIFLFNMIGFL